MNIFLEVIPILFTCSKCSKSYNAAELQWKCTCGGHLLYDHPPVFSRASIKTERMNMWRYDEAYPLKYEELQATYHEGMTPLVACRSDECNLRMKMDSLLPTGSFKDRGMVMIVNFLLKHGVKLITEDSSGNAGASTALYCALAGVKCRIYIPAGTSPGKIVQMRASGAEVIEVEGNREDAAKAARQHNESYAGHNWHPMYLQGLKSLAYELWEQNGFASPGSVIAATGNGGPILGLYIGFSELKANGLIDRIPRIFAVQSDSCNPIYRKFAGLEPLEKAAPTLAEGIALLNPNKIDLAIKAVTESGGCFQSVSESEIADALLELAKKGFYLEPTSAAAYAGLKKLSSAGVIQKKDDVIMIITGNGLKTTSTIMELLNHRKK